MKQRPGFRPPAQAKLRLRLENQGGRLLPELMVVIEQEHRWERGCKVINFCGFLLELPGIGKQVAEELFRFFPLAEFFARYSRVISHLAESPDAHLLEIAFDVRGGGPVTVRRFPIAGGGAGAAEPIINVALISEQVFGFAQIAGRGERALEVGAGGREVMMRECGPAQSKLRANVLSERAALTAFPGLELAAADKLRCLVVLAGLIVERAKLEAQVIALLHEVEAAGEFPQSSLRFLAKALPKLVALEEESRVFWVGAKRTIVSRPGFGWPLADVEIANAETAPNDGEIRVQFRAPFPKADSFLVSAAVEEQIAEMIRRPGVLRVGAHGGFENGNLFETGWEAVVG